MRETESTMDGVSVRRVRVRVGVRVGVRQCFASLCLCVASLSALFIVRTRVSGRVRVGVRMELWLGLG